jgi:MFS family permease
MSMKRVTRLFTKTFSLYRGLPRPVYAMFFAQVVNSIGHLVYPFLTFFLTQRLGYSSGAAGAFIFVASTAFVPGSLVGGKLADTLGRKRVLITAQGLAAAMLIPCAFLGTSPLIPWLLIGSNLFGGAADPCHEAITTDITRSDQRQAAFSFLYLGHNIGFAVGPIIAGFLFVHSLRWLFLGDVITTFIALAFVAVLVPETKPTDEEIEAHGEHSENERAETGGLLKALLKRPFLLGFAFLSLLLTFVYSQYTFSLPLQMEFLYPRSGPVYYGTLMTINALVVIFLTAPAIALTKKLRPLIVVGIAAVLFAAGFGMIFLVTSVPLLVFSTIVWTLGEILQATNTNVYIANHTPISHRGRFNSVLPIIIGTGFALGPPVMGQYIESYGVTAVWALTFYISLAGSAGLFLLYFLERRIERKKGE